MINVEDVNDNEPKFYSTLFQESVLENTPAGQSILRVQAYDADDGPNAVVSYRIKDAYALSHMPLTVDNQTGWIVTTRELDWEEGNLFEFVVVAQDHGEPPRSSTASVIIRVQGTFTRNESFDVYAAHAAGNVSVAECSVCSVCAFSSVFSSGAAS